MAITEPRPAPTQDLRIVEMFGPTIQGEGGTTGRAAQFLRLAGCNLACTWCDTAFSWDLEREDPERRPTMVTVDQVLERLDPRYVDPDAVPPRVRRLVITGGEPLLQAVGLAELSGHLGDHGWVLEVETSGTITPGPTVDLIDQFNVSPKLVHSGVGEHARLRWPILNEFAALPHAMFKFVAVHTRDLDEIADILDRLEPEVDPSRVMVMAEGTEPTPVLERSRALVDAVVARGWGMTPRWHTLLWGDERGR